MEDGNHQGPLQDAQEANQGVAPQVLGVEAPVQQNLVQEGVANQEVVYIQQQPHQILAQPQQIPIQPQPQVEQQQPPQAAPQLVQQVLQQPVQHAPIQGQAFAAPLQNPVQAQHVAPVPNMPQMRRQVPDIICDDDDEEVVYVGQVKRQGALEAITKGRADWMSSGQAMLNRDRLNTANRLQ